MTYRPVSSISIATPFSADAHAASSFLSALTPVSEAPSALTTITETRTLLTFPTAGLPSPCIVSQCSLRGFPVRYPTGSAPAQTQVNRWLCCRCAEDGYPDPVGMVHYASPAGRFASPRRQVRFAAPPFSHTGAGEGISTINVSSRASTSTRTGSTGASAQHRRAHPDPSHRAHGTEEGGHHAAYDDANTNKKNTKDSNDNNNNNNNDDDDNGNNNDSYATCWRPSCQHRKCVNCALYAGPFGLARSHREPQAKLLIRTVGGLHASPRFVDPVYWECAGCGEWVRNRFDSRCTLGVTGCCNEECVFAWGAGRAQLGSLGFGFGPGHAGAAGAGVLTVESVVMNRYGQRLGTADQRAAVAGGPWDFQRRALGDPRCAIVAGLRAAMKRPVEGMEVGRDGGRSRSITGVGRLLWDEGGLVPHYPYRRPPPVDETDVEENNEYEVSYLAGISAKPLDRRKGPRPAQYSAPSPNQGVCTGPRSVADSAVAHSVPHGFFPGWNHLQM